MTLKEIIETGLAILASLGGGGVIVLGLSTYLGKVWADRGLQNLRQEHTQLNLALQHQLNLVTQQAGLLLQIQANEQQVRFASLHEKRAQLIADLYKRLVDVANTAEKYIFQLGRSPKNEQGHPEAMTQLLELKEFFDHHRIYFPKEIGKLVGGFLDLVKEPVVHALVYGDIAYPNAQTLTESHQGFSKAFEAFAKDIPSAQLALAEEFRKILGVPATDRPSTTGS